MPPVSGSVIADRPAAGVAGVVLWVGGAGVICFYGVGFEERGNAGGLPATWLRNWMSSVEWAIHLPWESMRVMNHDHQDRASDDGPPKAHPTSKAGGDPG